MNHASVEEIEEQPGAVVGKLLINAFTALVLFDTGASHSFISRGFVDNYKLPMVDLKSPMLVSSLGAEYMASQGCYQLPITICRHVFPSYLIVLESQGLDVILGMDCLSKCEGTLIALVNQFFSPPQREKGSSMCLGMRRGGHR